MNVTAEEITKQLIFGSVTVVVSALLFVGIIFFAIALRRYKEINRMESHDATFILHMKKGYIFRVCYGMAVTADTVLSIVEISSTAIGAYIVLLQGDSTYIIAAVVLMISFIAAAFKYTLNLSTCRKAYAAAFRIMEFSANHYSASEKSIADKERLLQANILAEEIVSFMLE